MRCAHCLETEQTSGGLFCACGPTAACSLCDGAGCSRDGGWGWVAAYDEDESVEDADELAAWTWDGARVGYETTGEAN